jgi:hypothetical protein
MPNGQPRFKQVITLANRTACRSASFIRPAKSSAVPVSFVLVCRNLTGCSLSEMTSSRQASRVRPTSLFFSFGSLCGIGVPRETSSNLSCGVR